LYLGHYLEDNRNFINTNYGKNIKNIKKINGYIYIKNEKEKLTKRLNISNYTWYVFFFFFSFIHH